MYAIFTCYNDVITDKLKSHRKYDENLQFIQSLIVQESSTDQVTSYAFLQNFNPTANIICSIKFNSCFAFFRSMFHRDVQSSTSN